MKRILLVLLFLLVIVPSFAQKKAFTLPDLYKVKNVESPQFSPDGKRIAFVVAENFLDKGKSNADVYVMNADGSDLRRLTSDPATDNSPRWSPDGKSLLFVSNRKEGSQVWTLPMDGGEPRRLTSFSTETGNPIWLADGKHIGFSSMVFPECGADDSCNKKNDEGLSSGTTQAHMADRLFYRHWTFWKDGKRSHILVFDIDKGTYLDLTPGDFDAPYWSTSGGGFAFSPDGKELCFKSRFQ